MRAPTRKNGIPPSANASVVGTLAKLSCPNSVRVRVTSWRKRISAAWLSDPARRRRDTSGTSCHNCWTTTFGGHGTSAAATVPPGSRNRAARDRRSGPTGDCRPTSAGCERGREDSARIGRIFKRRRSTQGWRRPGAGAAAGKVKTAASVAARQARARRSRSRLWVIGKSMVLSRIERRVQLR